MSSEKPLRVLHVLGRLDRGGVENWLVDLLRIGAPAVAHDFCLMSSDRSPGVHDQLVRDAGAAIYQCPPRRNLARFAARFKAIVVSGAYNVVHSHVHLFSGYVLRLARQAGVARRVAQSHTDERLLNQAAGIKRRLYIRLMRRWIDRFATAGLACSEGAGVDLFGEGWRDDPRFRMLWCGIDLTHFATHDRCAVRRELSLARDQTAVVQVGRLAAVKNQLFTLEVAAAMRKQDPRVRFFLIGDGPDRASIVNRIAELGLQETVTLLGGRGDVPRLLAGFDAYVMPSLFEGFGMSAVEAQAAGLMGVVSTAVPSEVDGISGMVEHLDLSRGPVAWAEALMSAASRRPVWTPQILQELSAAGYSVEASYSKLIQTYEALPAEIQR